jgi:hypothetical protein
LIIDETCLAEPITGANTIRSAGLHGVAEHGVAQFGPFGRINMGSNNLTEDERKIVGACLRAAANGPFFPEWEFSTLFGLTRAEVKDVADRYPDVEENDDEPTGNDDSWLAINNTFANLLG